MRGSVKSHPESGRPSTGLETGLQDRRREGAGGSFPFGPGHMQGRIPPVGVPQSLQQMGNSIQREGLRVPVGDDLFVIEETIEILDRFLVGHLRKYFRGIRLVFSISSTKKETKGLSDFR